jgi:histidinol-phosphatase (PHP family)
MKLKLLRNHGSGRIECAIFWCPGCREVHPYTINVSTRPCWQWNANLEKPTFTPSLLCSKDDPKRICHLYLTDGIIDYLGDCHHALKGTKVPLIDIPGEWGEEEHQPYNLHTHTYRCQHASGDVMDYVRIAEAGGCQVLGFADHTPRPDGFNANGRMGVDQLPDYRAAVIAARSQTSMRILLGMECEWEPALKGFYQDMGCQYLIGSVHLYDPTASDFNIHAYTEKVIATIRAGIFAFIGHPDQFWFAPRQWTDEVDRCAEAICKEASWRKVPLEMNGNRIWDASGPEGTWPFFWDMARRHGCKIVINSDAHEPAKVLQNYSRMAAIRDHYGLIEAPVVDALCAS